MDRLESQISEERRALINTARMLASDPESSGSLTRPLVRRLLESMGPNPSMTALGLAAIEYLGCTFSWRGDAVRAVEAFGLMLCNCATLAGLAGLAIDPMFTLADQLRIRGEVSPLSASGMLAGAIRAPNGKPRRSSLVEAIAMVVAQGLDNVEIMHDLNVRPLELLLVTAREVLGDERVASVTTESAQSPAAPRILPVGAPVFTDLTATERSEIDAGASARHRRLDPDRHQSALEQLQAGVELAMDARAEMPGAFEHLVDTEIAKIDDAATCDAMSAPRADVEPCKTSDTQPLKMTPERTGRNFPPPPRRK